MPNVMIIGGCNGSDKSTAAPVILQDNIHIENFVNADVIAQGLSAFQLEKSVVRRNYVSGVNNAGVESIHLQLIILALLGCALIQIQQIKYLNNIVEQDHRGIKRMIKPMMGFKAFHSAEATLAGIELYRMLKKEQYISCENAFLFEQFYALAA